MTGIVPLKELDKESVLSEAVFAEIFDQEDEIYKARLLLSVQERAKELGVATKFNELVKAYKRVERAMKRQKKDAVATLNNWTNFSGGNYDNMYCGAWIATDDGIYAQNFQSANDIVACYHPILPVERLKNLETGEEHLILAYKRNGIWREVKVRKNVVASASKIVALSDQGISVTSENAKYLVKYLSDVENLNDSEIPVQESTAKLGWHGEKFVPYCSDILFDGDDQFRDVSDSVRHKGDENDWLQHVLQLRASGKKQVRIALAVSFASVLVSRLGCLPFIVDFWGQSGSGKSLLAMVAASVWADPAEKQYIGDFKTTEVGLEVRCDMLNHLPVILDDTSKVSARIRENFEGLVYDLCSGKGKSRSDKNLGLRRENRWKNCILTNGERPLRSYVQQGGAINRILEIECVEGIFRDPAETVDTLQKNYGYAGEEFIRIIQGMDTATLKQIQKGFQQQIEGPDNVQKQSLALSVILTADQIATDGIFGDGMYLSLADLEEALVDVNELSDNERCYQYILDKIAMNGQRFDAETKVEKWGMIEHGYAVIYSQAFDELCKSGGFSKMAFLAWADREDLIQTQGGKRTKVKRVGDCSRRCVFLRLDGAKASQDGFIPADEMDQEELPFV